MVSVCIATYNGEKYVAEQLRSILVQLQPTDEVIISDDGSSDNTCAIIQAFQDPRIHLLHNQAHNHKWNFQNALMHAKGDVIFLADQDDVWMDNKYDMALQALQDYDLVMLNSVLTDEHLQPMHPSFFQYYHSGTGMLKNTILCTYFGSHMAFRRRILDYALPFPNATAIFHDGWLGLIAEIVGKVHFIQTPTMYYRRHTNAPTDVTNSLLTRSKRNILVKITDRITFAYHIFLFYINYVSKHHNHNIQ